MVIHTAIVSLNVKPIDFVQMMDSEAPATEGGKS